jgi:hypothetical protein
MILANELRIGNFVDFGEVTSLSAKNINVIKKNWLFTCDYEDVNPIKLTEEWLIKFGFINVKNYQKYKSGQSSKSWINRSFYIRIDLEKFNNEDYFSFCFRYGSVTLFICSVHELQNLYFSLTKEELTLNKILC